ncbi:MAG: hypothetical protein M3R50_05730, partial [Bacteroidota bacterium]|nr:hypothetical protein [Bacteroidota bacterium]
MKHLIILAIFLFKSNFTYCQLNPVDQFNEQKVKIVKQSMLVLAGWGATNCIYNGFSTGNSTG